MKHISKYESFEFESNDMLYEIIQRFKSNTLTPEDLKRVYVTEEICKWDKNPWGDKCYLIGNSCIYPYELDDSELKSNLNKESLHIIKTLYNKHIIKCQVLCCKKNSDLGESIGLKNAFYQYNPNRSLPDSMLALKVIDVIYPKPKNKGYRVVS